MSSAGNNPATTANVVPLVIVWAFVDPDDGHGPPSALPAPASVGGS